MNQKDKLTPYQEILDKTVERNIPFLMQFELTSKCNLRCIHCYFVPERAKLELSTKKIKSILDELSNEGTLFIGFTGGEILCREDFFQIARYARKRRFALRLFTNATLITAEIADKIKDMQPLTVEISLYATNPHIHDGITGVSGSYNKTLSAINMLRKRKSNIIIKSIIMKENAQQYDKLKAFAEDIGARFVYDYVIIPRIDGCMQPLGHCMSDFEIEDLICRNVNPVRSTGSTSDNKASNGVKIDVEDNLGRLEGLPDKDQPICGAARDGACISAYGDVYPCVTWRISLGNLKEKGFKEIWNSPTTNEIRDLTMGDMKYCSNCGLFYYCNHCPGIALLETGDSLGLSPTSCRVAKLKKEAIYMAHSL